MFDHNSIEKEASRSSYYKKARKKAEDIAGDKSRVYNLLEKAVSKAGAFQLNSKMKEAWNYVTALVRLIRAYYEGSYRSLPWKSLLKAISGLVYLVFILDFIPDFIPITGYLDDAAIIYWVISSIKGDLDDFLNWEESQNISNTIVINPDSEAQ